MKYYTKDYISPQAYKLVEADIGWRWCKDELPEKGDRWTALDDQGKKSCATSFEPETGHWFDRRMRRVDNVVQWCKLPEPLERVKKYTAFEIAKQALEGEDE